MDIKCGSDVDPFADCTKWWESIVRDEPLLVIGSIHCTMFSRLQDLNKHMYRNSETWMQKFQFGMEQVRRYVRFCAQIYERQRKHGRLFMHEHFWLATSWSLGVMEKLLAYEDVERVQTHVCQFVMTSRIGGVGSELGLVLKPTGFMTNSPCIAPELARLTSMCRSLVAGQPAQRSTPRSCASLYAEDWPSRSSRSKRQVTRRYR